MNQKSLDGKVIVHQNVDQKLKLNHYHLPVIILYVIGLLKGRQVLY